MGICREPKTRLPYGGRDHQGVLTQYVVLTDWRDANSWINMSTQPDLIFEQFKDLSVGRCTAVELWTYHEKDNGDFLAKRESIMQFDKGVWPNIVEPTAKEIQKNIEDFLLGAVCAIA